MEAVASPVEASAAEAAEAGKENKRDGFCPSLFVWCAKRESTGCKSNLRPRLPKRSATDHSLLESLQDFLA